MWNIIASFSGLCVLYAFMNKDEVLEILKPYAETIHNCITFGFDAYGNKYSDTSADHSSRTRASIIRDEMVKAAKNDLCAQDGVKHVKTKTDRDIFCIQERVIVQFKRLVDKLLVRNYPTDTAKLFNGNAQVALDGIPPNLPRINAGYVPSVDWLNVNGIYITYQNMRGLSWFIDLKDVIRGYESATQLTLDAPILETAQRVRLKGGNRNESNVVGGQR